LNQDSQRKKNLGLGERTTDVLLPDVSFEALLELFNSNDFARTRPNRHLEEPSFDFIRAAREEGANIVQDFHEGWSKRGGQRYEILADICAFANANGGTLYIGLSADPGKAVLGITEPEQAISVLEKEIGSTISPPLACNLDVKETGGKKIIRVLIPRGEDPPYAVDDNKVYVRSEGETGLAVRDEIVELVIRGQSLRLVLSEQAEPQTTEPVAQASEPKAVSEELSLAPRTGVEVVGYEERSGTRYFTMRDLRNGNMVKNVTRTSARRLWHYAITTFDKYPADLPQSSVQWQDDYGLVNRYKQGKSWRYDVLQRTPQGYRYYFGVTEDGIHGPWEQLVGQEDE
jgi:hypothetical protein